MEKLNEITKVYNEESESYELKNGYGNIVAYIVGDKAALEPHALSGHLFSEPENSELYIIANKGDYYKDFDFSKFLD